MQCTMLEGRVAVLDGVVRAFAVINDGTDDVTISTGRCGASAHDCVSRCELSIFELIGWLVRGCDRE